MPFLFAASAAFVLAALVVRSLYPAAARLGTRT